ncbi:hypothetical protein WJX81_003730 [Elliptochloris bilobata]|uniref:Enoyl reductase (ER) domain-containing protein n=1 Tax=Elliptochloris bilobata TaxID=381761 RepID=A0AAW1S8F0_9CHLO
MATRTQKAVQVVQLTADPEENLRLVHDAPVAIPEEGKVLVNMLVRPVNPVDIYGLMSHDPDAKLDRPKVPGYEGVGKVAVLGPGTSGFAVGDRVVSMSPWLSTYAGQGTWQQFVVFPEADLLKVPDGVSDSDAAQFLINPATALGLFKTLAVPKGEWLLQTAAGSVLGRLMIAIAKRAGVKTINVVRRSEQAAELLKLGADVVIGTDEEDMAERVKDVTGGKGVYGATDAVAGKTTGEIVSLLRPHGTVLLYGALAGWDITVPVGPLLMERRRVEGFGLFDWLPSLGPEGARAALDELWSLFLDGTIKPYSGESYPLEKAAEAVKASLQDARGPKILLVG